MSEGSVEDTHRVLYVLQHRPKWVLLLISLKRFGPLSRYRAMELLGISKGSLRSAIAFFSTLAPPAVKTMKISKVEEAIILTDYGDRLATLGLRLVSAEVLKHARASIRPTEEIIERLRSLGFVAIDPTRFVVPSALLSAKVPQWLTVFSGYLDVLGAVKVTDRGDLYYLPPV